MGRYSSDSGSDSEDYDQNRISQKTQFVYIPNEECDKRLEEVSKKFATAKVPPPPPLGVSRLYTASPIYKNNNRLLDHQLDGLNWLLSLWSNGRSGFLADEAGLGKTIQCIALLNHMYTKENIKGPFLIVAPYSALENWKRVAEEWTDMNVCFYYDEGSRAGRDALRQYEWFHQILDIKNAPPTSENGQQQQQQQQQASNSGSSTNQQQQMLMNMMMGSDQFSGLNFDMQMENQGGSGSGNQKRNGSRLVTTGFFKFQILLTTFDILLQDAEVFEEVPFKFMIVDEAHRLRASNSKTTQALKNVPCRHSLLLSGVPLQNSTQELYALLNFMEPVRFCSQDAFLSEFGNLKDRQQLNKLHTLLKPYLLRRTLEDVERTNAETNAITGEAGTAVGTNVDKSDDNNDSKQQQQQGVIAVIENNGEGVNKLAKLRAHDMRPMALVTRGIQFSEEMRDNFGDWMSNISNEPDAAAKRAALLTQAAAVAAMTAGGIGFGPHFKRKRRGRPPNSEVLTPDQTDDSDGFGPKRKSKLPDVPRPRGRPPKVRQSLPTFEEVTTVDGAPVVSSVQNRHEIR